MRSFPKMARRCAVLAACAACMGSVAEPLPAQPAPTNGAPVAPSGAATQAVASVQTPAPTNRPPETFFLETMVKGDACQQINERVRLEMRRTAEALTSVYRSERDDGSEFVAITGHPDGGLLSATKIEQDARGRETCRSRIWFEDDMVHVERIRASGRKSVRSRRLDGREVVADAGLLFRLRAFPFDDGKELDLRIAAFSQHFVPMRVKLVGRETIRVPAGEFDCYKLVGVVDLVVKQIVTTYWLSAEEPHFLVKYEGKRGLFIAPTYETSLTSMQ
jgi:hypothetical protein